MSEFFIRTFALLMAAFLVAGNIAVVKFWPPRLDVLDFSLLVVFVLVDVVGGLLVAQMMVDP